MKPGMFGCVAALLLLSSNIGTAAAGKITENRAVTPRAATTATTKVSPFVDVRKQVKADMTGSKNFRRCKTRACLHSHQH